MTPEQIATEANAIEPGQNHGEFSKLIALLQGRQIHNVMEIGTEGGCTFYAWCKIATGKKISLDWQNSGVGRGRWPTEELRAPRDAQLQSWSPDVHLVEANSHLPETLDKVKEILGGELLDFLFIDGDHSFAGVLKDWEMYSPLVAPGGIVAFHDIKNCEYHIRAGCFVHDFWPLVRGNKIELLSNEHIWGGIGVVFV